MIYVLTIVAGLAGFLQSLPTALLAALAFIFVVFLLALIKLQIEALSKRIEAIRKETDKSIHGLYESLARIERTLDEISRTFAGQSNRINDNKGQNSG